VTLLTGDRITLASAVADGVAVQPGKGRDAVRFTVHRDRDSLFVIPSDAAPLIRAGKLDRRLFDVRGLVRAGYHDAVRDSLPLVVRYGAVSARSAAGTLSAAGAQVTRELSVVDGAAVAAKKDSAAKLWATLTAGRGFDKIWLDGKREVSLDQSVPQIGAPAAWEAGYTGEGVTVAVLDTGVDATHPDLAGKVAESRNFSEAADERDTVGHGTHVASTIAGSGAASGGKYKGVAPDATLLSGKVCETNFCTESAILAGLEWASAEKGAKIVNFSIGGFDGPEIDPIEEAVNTLTAAHGTLFVVAAGNSGSSDGSVESPGSAEAALTVGAVDKSDELADFSSRGPRIGDDGLKPDITAPGVDIVAARAAGTAMGETVGEHYTTASGTSMATPHVVGAAALLAQQHPDWKAGKSTRT
jgi:subtilisin family serine protease